MILSKIYNILCIIVIKQFVREMSKKIGMFFGTLAHQVQKLAHRLASWHAKFKQ